MTLVDVRFGKMDAEDHLFVRIGEDWAGDKNSGLMYAHVSKGMMLAGELQFSEISEKKP